MNAADTSEKRPLTDENKPHEYPRSGHEEAAEPKTPPGEAQVPTQWAQESGQPAETAAPAVEAAPPAEAAEPRRPSWFKRLGIFLFNPETRLGRAVRATLRWTALVVAIFALGFLIAYVLLYQPAQKDLNATRQSLEAAETRLEENRAALDASARRVEDLQTENEALQNSLEAALRRGNLLKMLHHVNTARLSLMDEDSSAAAAALDEASRELEQFLPWLEAEDSEFTKTLSLRLELASDGLTRDPATALADLEILSNTLLLLDRVILTP